MYLCKRKTNKFRNLATLIFLNIAILSCSFSPVNSDSEIIVNKIKFDLSVPINIKNNLSIFVKENEASSTEVNISEFGFKENNFYGGENLGSLEVRLLEVFRYTSLVTRSILKRLVLQEDLILKALILWHKKN